MKKILILSLALCLSLSLFSCSSCGDNQKENKDTVIQEKTTLFQGNIKEVSIKVSEVPKTVINAVKSKYPDAKIIDAKKIDNSLDKTYKLEIDNNGEQLKLHITESGDFLSE